MGRNTWAAVAIGLLLTTGAARADYGGQGPITKAEAIISAEAMGAMTQESQAMEEAFHGHLASDPHDHCFGGPFDSTDVAHGYRTPDERIKQGEGQKHISGSPAPLLIDPSHTLHTQ